VSKRLVNYSNHISEFYIYNNQRYRQRVQSKYWPRRLDTSTAVTGQQAVVSGGPAANAGLQAGDIITAIDSQELNQNTSLTSIVDRDQVGQVVDLTVKRGSKTIDVKVTLGAVPADTTTNGVTK